jgi:hypothetical protein
MLMAAGGYGDIAVLTSSEEVAEASRAALARINAPVDFIIKEEEPFKIDVFPGEKWKYGKNYKNLLIFVVWSDGGPLVKAVGQLVGAEDLTRLKQGDGGLVQVPEPYATFQLAIVVTAQDRNTLASLLRRNSDRIRELLETQGRERLRQQWAREGGTHEDLLQRYWRDHRFLLEVPRIYRENQSQPNGFPAIEWIRTGPTRGITLAWERAADPAALLADRDRLLALRRRMGETMHSETLDDRTFAWEDSRLGENPALKLTGLWISDEIQGGGVFWSYFLADERGGRVFCVDLLTYAPDMDKMPFFREMLAVGETFSLAPPHP